ncbi:GNAT family N-acetyltransferase [Candidatus Babeliales bacterium]|nr:GNAT family N-acetyltransferase [Candidatus Babeliales bacterium]
MQYIIKKIIIFVLIIIGCGAGYFYWQLKTQQNDTLKIIDTNFEHDADAIDALFHKGDNFYWMVAGNPDYSVKFMLEHATTSQYEKRHDLILRSAMIDGKLVGFAAYYKISQHVWRLLYLIVDQDFRKQGIAKKLLNSTIEEMVQRGALKVILFTRNNNFKAQSMYKKFGFKIVDTDEIGVWMSWLKS